MKIAHIEVVNAGGSSAQLRGRCIPRQHSRWHARFSRKSFSYFLIILPVAGGCSHFSSYSYSSSFLLLLILRSFSVCHIQSLRHPTNYVNRTIIIPDGNIFQNLSEILLKLINISLKISTDFGKLMRISAKISRDFGKLMRIYFKILTDV